MAAGRFDEIWAIDWSGARGNLRGIAVARLPVGAGAKGPELLRPAAPGHWTRRAVVDRLAAAILEGRRILVGFDFAFGLPVETLAPLGLAGCRGLPEVWRAVDRTCAGAPDLHGGGFVAASPPGVFWTRGARPEGWIPAMRLTDTRCAETGAAHPESVMKLVGARQVGLAALAGMRSLLALSRACGDRLAIWPADAPDRPSVAVEMFPTLYRRAATGRSDKLRDEASLNLALAHHGCAPVRLGLAGPPSDDQTDALVGAAGLRQAAGRCDAFALPAAARVRREGWIFGVPP